MKRRGFFSSRRVKQKSDLYQKAQAFWEALFRFIWRHKIAVFVLIIIFVFLAFVLKIVLGPFGFITSRTPSLAGFFGEKTYLVVLQNENEIRPTGGFITSFAVVKMKNGSPSIEVFDSISLSPPKELQKAPSPIEKIFSNSEKYRGWVFHDSGFSMDFVENAEKAIWFIQQDERFAELDFDGLIAVDTYAISNLIDLYAPFAIEGEELNSENLFQILEKHSKDFDFHNEAEWKNRKGFFAPLAQNLASRITSSPTKWGDFFDFLGQMSEEKHIQFYFADEDLQADFSQQNWTGKLPEEDFFAVNFANLGGRKADRYIQKSYKSSFYLDADGNMTEKLTINLAHEGTYNLFSDRYEAFVRIVRPEGVILKSSSGDFETEIQEECEGINSLVNCMGGSQFSHFLVMNPRDTKIFSYEFLYPDKIALSEPQNIYFLKQAGTIHDEYKISFSGANDQSFNLSGCDNILRRENVSMCDFNLFKDQKISFIREPDTFPPLLQWAEFSAENKIELRFSEQIAPSLSARTIKIVDLNESNSVNDEIVVDNVEIKGLAVILTFSGATYQKGEFYRVSLPSLHDVSGNYSTKNPFEATVRRR